MQNSITIRPANGEIELKLKALEHINWFASMGFTHQAFITLVAYHHPDFKDGPERRRLSNWWYTKIVDEDINSKVDMVIKQLKNE